MTEWETREGSRQDQSELTMIKKAVFSTACYATGLMLVGAVFLLPYFIEENP